jgi:hypothetical protein
VNIKNNFFIVICSFYLKNLAYQWGFAKIIDFFENQFQPSEPTLRHDFVLMQILLYLKKNCLKSFYHYFQEKST